MRDVLQWLVIVVTAINLIVFCFGPKFTSYSISDKGGWRQSLSYDLTSIGVRFAIILTVGLLLIWGLRNIKSE